MIGGVDLSREEAVHRFLHLVKYVAGRISVTLPPHVELSDLFNDGVLGLIDAIEKYDDGRGVKFETYAITRINGAILDALRSLDWVPRAVRQSGRTLDRASQDLEAELGRAPTQDELAERLGVTIDKLDHMMQRLRGTAVVSLEEKLPNARGFNVPLADTIEAEGDDIPAQVEEREVFTELQRAVRDLPPQERTVIERYYFGGETLKEIKATMNVSESRVSQVHSQAVIRLRSRLRELSLELGFDEPGVKRKYSKRSGAAPPAD